MWPAAQISRLAASCTLMLALSGSLLVPPVLYSAMAASAGVAQAHVTALMPAAYAVGSLTLTLPGSMFMERFGLRRSFVLGTTLQALFASIQVASVQLWQLVALQFAQGACHCFAGTVGFIAFCNAWFGEAPSTAIAVNFAAFGLAGVLWTPAAAAIAARFSWRAAIGAVAAVQWGVALPLAALCMRDPPPAAPKRRPSRVAREHGSIGGSGGGGADEARATWWVRDASIWLLSLLSFCVLYVTYGVNNSFTLFLADEAGVPLPRASLFTSLLFLCNMLGKCGGGPAFDSRYGGAAAATACALLLGGSALLCHLAWRPTAGAEAVGFAVLYGLGYGGSFALVQSKAALHFGHRRGFKTLQGFLFGWQMAGMITGELLTPELAHAFSYTAAFAAIAAVAATALLALLAFEKREAQIGQGTSLKVPLV